MHIFIFLLFNSSRPYLVRSNIRHHSFDTIHFLSALCMHTQHVHFYICGGVFLLLRLLLLCAGGWMWKMRHSVPVHSTRRHTYILSCAFHAVRAVYNLYLFAAYVIVFVWSAPHTRHSLFNVFLFPYKGQQITFSNFTHCDIWHMGVCVCVSTPSTYIHI